MDDPDRYSYRSSRQDFMLAVIAGTPFLAALVVGLRVYGRWRGRIPLAWDDYLLLLANVLSIALIAPSVTNVKMFHYGIHVWNVRLKDLEPEWDDYHKVLLAYNCIHTLILPLVKASIMILLLRIGSVVTLVRRAVYVIFVFNILACLGPWTALIFMCPPRTGGTTAKTVFGGLKCLNSHQAGLVFVFIITSNLALDLLIFPIPVYMIVRLKHTKVRMKLFAIASFALSLGATAIGVIRLWLYWDTMLFNHNASDWTYNIHWCLNHAENNAAIIIACIPTLRALILSWSTGDRNQSDLRKRRTENSNSNGDTFGSSARGRERETSLVVVPSATESLPPSTEKGSRFPSITMFSMSKSSEKTLVTSTVQSQTNSTTRQHPARNSFDDVEYLGV